MHVNMDMTKEAADKKARSHAKKAFVHTKE